MNQQILEQIAEAMAIVDSEKVKELVEKAIQEKVPASDIVLKGLSKGLKIVGQKYESMDYFLSELIMAGEIMKNTTSLLKPYLEKEPMESTGLCAIGTVRGDIHDLGKNIVITMLQSAGFQIHDLGVDVPTEMIVEKVKEVRPELLGLSAMLLSTMPAMKEVTDALKKQGTRKKVKVIVGGRPLNKDIAKEYGADEYAKDAIEAVKIATRLVRK
jgi:5-methyltetrahydrofolate--homocysteine methyltransferase